MYKVETKGGMYPEWVPVQGYQDVSRRAATEKAIEMAKLYPNCVYRVVSELVITKTHLVVSINGNFIEI